MNGTQTGIEQRRTNRGDEQVTFDQVGDHLTDYVVKRPDASATA
jgi:hypothetical protein